MLYVEIDRRLYPDLNQIHALGNHSGQQKAVSVLIAVTFRISTGMCKNWLNFLRSATCAKKPNEKAAHRDRLFEFKWSIVDSTAGTVPQPESASATY